MDGKAWLDRAGETSREIRLVSRYDAASLGKDSLPELKIELTDKK